MKRMDSSIDHVENKTPVVGTVFRFVDVKRPEMWIEVAKRVHQELNGEVLFRLIGDGPRMESCKSIVNQLGLDDDFELLGFREDVLSQLNSFDVFLMTSSVEGLPNVLIEAQAMGVPVVTTDVGGALADADLLLIDDERKVIVKNQTKLIIKTVRVIR